MLHSLNQCFLAIICLSRLSANSPELRKVQPLLVLPPPDRPIFVRSQTCIRYNKVYFQQQSLYTLTNLLLLLDSQVRSATVQPVLQNQTYSDGYADPRVTDDKRRDGDKLGGRR